MTAEADRKRGERLRAFVDAAKGEPAGFDACSTWPAQWVANETGREFDWPAFADRAEMDAYVEAAGGLVGVWERFAAVIGVPQRYDIDAAGVGDVGIIETSDGRVVGGIFTFGGVFCWRSDLGVNMIGVAGRSFPVRTDDGWQQRPVVVKVWQVPWAG